MEDVAKLQRGVHSTVSFCRISGKQVVQSPGQVYLAGGEERKGARLDVLEGQGNRGSGTPALGLRFFGRRKTEIRSHLWLKGEC